MVNNRLFLNLSLLIALVSPLAVSAFAIQDPTRPSNHIKKNDAIEKASVVKQELTAIFFKDGKGSAIINGKLYRQGDNFSGSKIVTIKTNSVLLKNLDGYHRLTLINTYKKLKK